jgi:hypothetical protein
MKYTNLYAKYRYKHKRNYTYHEKMQMKLMPGYCHICGKLNKSKLGLRKHTLLAHPMKIKEISPEGVVIYEQPAEG